MKSLVRKSQILISPQVALFPEDVFVKTLLYGNPIFDENDNQKRWWSNRKTQWNLGIVKNSLQNEFDSQRLCNEKYRKTKIKSYNGKINTNFHNNEIPKKLICLSVILINSFLEHVKILILKYFEKKVSMLLKEKRFLSIFLMI